MASVQMRSFYIFMTAFMCFESSCCERLRRTVTEHEGESCNRSHSKFVCNYIPKDLPTGIETVRLINVDGGQYPDYTLTEGTFSSDTWKHVKALEISADESWLLNSHQTVGVFDSSCFLGLRSMEQLHISISNYFRFMSGTLLGLDNLKNLDIVGCSRFDIEDLIKSLNYPGVVPNIRRLNISRLNSYRQGITINDTFFKLLSDKNIKELDVSGIQVLNANFTAFFENFGTLEYLNLSRIMVSDFSDAAYPQIYSNLKYVDLSLAVLPSNIIPERGLPVKHISNIKVPLNLNWIWTRFFHNVEYIDLSGILPDTTSYVFENVTVVLQGTSELHLKTLILRNNNFERLNMNVIAQNLKLQSVDLSGCNIRFLHPGTLASFDALTRIDLSNNNLNEMMAKDSIHLGNLFRKLSKIRNVNLAGNQFTRLPRDIFKFNVQLEMIDLSNNMISQITLDTSSLKSVVFLNLTKNSIKTLDDASMKRLGDMISLRSTADNDLHTPPLLLKDNPISCKDCDSFAFLDWLMKHKFLSEIKCYNEQSEHVYLSTEVIQHVQDICERPKVIVISCAALTGAILVAIGVAIVVRRYRRQRIYELEMDDRIALIREGAEEHQFVVFLSYCSKDDLFVHNHVYNSLNENLQYTTGEHRDLVCEGDRNFQLGRPLHDQISVLLKKSSVVVVVLTNNYSLSVHCRNEFDQAFMLEKPIVLMVKDEVDTELMTPLIRDMYEKKTRILWKYENDNYVLKTSWENVCTSIIELIESG